MMQPSAKLCTAPPIKIRAALLSCSSQSSRVTVAPDDELFQHEESQNAAQQRSKDELGVELGEGFGEQREQCHPQQGADCVANQSGNDTLSERASQQ